jgi:hypothetical protein
VQCGPAVRPHPSHPLNRVVCSVLSTLHYLRYALLVQCDPTGGPHPSRPPQQRFRCGAGGSCQHTGSNTRTSACRCERVCMCAEEGGGGAQWCGCGCVGICMCVCVGGCEYSCGCGWWCGCGCGCGCGCERMLFWCLIDGVHALTMLAVTYSCAQNTSEVHADMLKRTQTYAQARAYTHNTHTPHAAIHRQWSCGCEQHVHTIRGYRYIHTHSHALPPTGSGPAGGSSVSTNYVGIGIHTRMHAHALPPAGSGPAGVGSTSAPRSFPPEVAAEAMAASALADVMLQLSPQEVSVCKKRLAFYVCTFVLCVVCNVSYVMCVCVCAVYVLASNVRVHACVFMYVCVCVCIYCWRT